jgi:hypothetical protein
MGKTNLASPIGSGKDHGRDASKVPDLCGRTLKNESHVLKGLDKAGRSGLSI